MTTITRVARIVALACFVAGTVVAGLRWGLTAALLPAGGTILCLVELIPTPWPMRVTRGNDKDEVVVPLVAMVPTAASRSAVVGFHSDVMDRLATGDYPVAEVHPAWGSRSG
jgi:hypothetical protein